MVLTPRKDIRLPYSYYVGRRSYFVTICVRDRKKLFVLPELVNPLIRQLVEVSARFQFDVYAYCFMPDHCHLLLQGKSPACDLQVMVRNFKGRSSVALRKIGLGKVWQKGFYEHILRTGEEQAAATAYIFENPIRAGLSKDVYTYLFSGSLSFDWRKFQFPEIKFNPHQSHLP